MRAADDCRTAVGGKVALDAVAFTVFERTAHDSIANRYAKVFTPLTSLAVAPLLDAARVAMGQRLLDVGTGPGVAAVAARARGAVVTGVDVSHAWSRSRARSIPASTSRWPR
jgi:cyclopropane fatty-acyl-phospholipid synthase-like methyltransferase